MIRNHNKWRVGWNVLAALYHHVRIVQAQCEACGTPQYLVQHDP